MTSLVLSKNTLKMAFGGGLPNDEISTYTVPERPKTAGLGKRRPLTDSSPDADGYHYKQDYEEMRKCSALRPKTSHGNHELSSNDVKMKTTSKPRESVERFDLDTALEDIDIVEYFYDNSRDIFPLSQDEQINKNGHNQNKTKNMFNRLDSGRTIDKSTKSEISSHRKPVDSLQRQTMHNNCLSSEVYSTGPHTSGKKLKPMSRIPIDISHEKPDDKVTNIDIYTIKRATGGFKETKADMHKKINEGQIQQRSPDYSCSFGRPKNYDGFITSRCQSHVNSETGMQSSPCNDKFVSKRNANKNKPLTKYTNDFRFIDNSSSCRADRFRHKIMDYSVDRPDSFQYKPNKYPRKLKPIAGSNGIKTVNKET
ncbi:uncharacterized protein LOC134723795 [Mytilus trossulus]|uniref:uncharacterized protein LOC134723795 n=1 Tax=Mytilus trossulus TaxID=6551 RepID=UPI0030043435